MVKSKSMETAEKVALLMGETLLYQRQWRIMDQSALGPGFDPLQSFAIDDTLCESVGGGYAPPTARAWVHHRMVVLGIQDTRLPLLEEGLRFLAESGYRHVVRTSGGLAVPLDEGILNLTLVFPEREHAIDINRGYEAMYAFVRAMFRDLTGEIEAREIAGSYCPGNYDLSIRGKKFAGISQRRLKKGVAVQIYLCVAGSGSERAEVIRQFYARGIRDLPVKYGYPKIVPENMASLSELLGRDLTVEEAVLRFFRTVRTFSGGNCYSGALNEEEMKRYPYYYGRVLERNEKWLKNTDGK
jgi:octanoyl-[GcvH]:protein N-octanoyltransferase